MRTTLLLLLTMLISSTAFAQTVIITEREEWTERMTEFDQQHYDDYVAGALSELTGESIPSGLSTGEYAALVLGILEGLPVYGEKQVAVLEPEIPGWLRAGHRDLNPTMVAHSRYFDALDAGTELPEVDLGALFAFYCVYDAEWFTLARHADYKAWLSAVMLSYPPLWLGLRGDTRESMHAGLVDPLEDPAMFEREIDNWIRRFDLSSEAFAKPKVRDALVAELLERAALTNMDDRLTEEQAYSTPVPPELGLSERGFFLLAALTLEYFQEIYELEPTTRQPLHFRDYFLAAYGELRQE